MLLCKLFESCLYLKWYFNLININNKSSQAITEEQMRASADMVRQACQPKFKVSDGMYLSCCNYFSENIVIKYYHFSLQI